MDFGALELVDDRTRTVRDFASNPERAERIKAGCSPKSRGRQTRSRGTRRSRRSTNIGRRSEWEFAGSHLGGSVKHSSVTFSVAPSNVGRHARRHQQCGGMVRLRTATETAAQQCRKPPKPKPDVAQLCLPDFTPYRGFDSENPEQLSAHIGNKIIKLRDTATLVSASSATLKAARTSGFRFECYSASENRVKPSGTSRAPTTVSSA
ncbi:hypothetical protein FFLO_06786 [Filobasidium floriforme]|uniref:Uncharacterized protein n=1 Tax=Filobasidium floriforme TaxID=5210 RepID=A0A8K0JGL9_9TREE|nr:hypothetical protein FFLO_06786 [Filobasidium floriforme]